ncbi:MAG TPA: hypothetical protein VHL11_04450, partial [Phototrophicaceae bacterium]|nr:hypothetical protein [Phototrophicaceae bacterium]
TGTTFAAGDILDFSGFIDAKGKVKGTIKLSASYTDASDATKGKVKLEVTSGYAEAITTLPLTGGSDVLDRIRIQLIHKSISGRVRIDTLSLTLSEAAVKLAPMPLPLP